MRSLSAPTSVTSSPEPLASVTSAPQTSRCPPRLGREKTGPISSRALRDSGTSAPGPPTPAPRAGGGAASVTARGSRDNRPLTPRTRARCSGPGPLAGGQVRGTGPGPPERQWRHLLVSRGRPRLLPRPRVPGCTARVGGRRVPGERPDASSPSGPRGPRGLVSRGRGPGPGSSLRRRCFLTLPPRGRHSGPHEQTHGTPRPGRPQPPGVHRPQDRPPRDQRREASPPPVPGDGKRDRFGASLAWDRAHRGEGFR